MNFLPDPKSGNWLDREQKGKALWPGPRSSGLGRSTGTPQPGLQPSPEPLRQHLVTQGSRKGDSRQAAKPRSWEMPRAGHRHRYHMALPPLPDPPARDRPQLPQRPAPPLRGMDLGQERGRPPARPIPGPDWAADGGATLARARPGRVEGAGAGPAGQRQGLDGTALAAARGLYRARQRSPPGRGRRSPPRRSPMTSRCSATPDRGRRLLLPRRALPQPGERSARPFRPRPFQPPDVARDSRRGRPGGLRMRAPLPLGVPGDLLVAIIPARICRRGSGSRAG